jgi:primary-amine oxidase
MQNFAGNSFETRKRFFDTTADGVTDAAPQNSRVWNIVNEGKKHYASKQPVGYKVCVPSSCDGRYRNWLIVSAL